MSAGERSPRCMQAMHTTELYSWRGLGSKPCLRRDLSALPGWPVHGPLQQGTACVAVGFVRFEPLRLEYILTFTSKCLKWMLIPTEVLRLMFPAAIRSHYQTGKALWLVLMQLRIPCRIAESAQDQKKHKLRERPGFFKARSPLICYPPIQIRRPVWMAMLKMIPIFNF